MAVNYDAHKNLAGSLVATAPSPPSSGTSLVVTAGQGTLFPAAPFNVLIWPIGVQPTPTNSEIARCTVLTTDTMTLTRATESSSARSVLVGDQIAATITVKTLTDLEARASQTILTTTGDMLYASAANVPARLAIGTTSQLPFVIGGIPAWKTRAFVYAVPADQTGTASGTPKMLGLGAAASPTLITPAATGNVEVTLSGTYASSVILDGGNIVMVYGTGAAPANAATAAGIGCSAQPSYFSAVANQKLPFSITGAVSGLTLGTQYWFDLQTNAVTGGTFSLFTITAVLKEV